MSAEYSVVDTQTMRDLIEQIQTVFDLEPFEKQPLKELLEGAGQIPVIIMKGYHTEGRERSFYQDNKIYALLQGADNKNKDKAVFLGDSFVIVDKAKVNIQIHKIVPKRQTEGGVIAMPEYTQYMFAIYVPKEKKYFIKG